ncbi:MAG: GNAT family N-acetyltransferase [Novosphingobium sp.]
MILPIEVLRSKRLVFQTWVPEDECLLFDLHSDLRVQKSYAPGPEKWTRAGIAKRFGEYREEQANFGLTKWKVSLLDGTFAGRGGWSPWGEGTLEIGYAFKPEFWGFGLASEAAEALLGWALQHRVDSQLVGFALTDNAASRRILEKLGMEFVDLRQIGGIENAYYSFPERRTPAATIKD